MSPEQASGMELDGRTDIFSLGLVLYELVTGKQVFAGNSIFGILDNILSKEPVPIPQNSALPAELNRILQKAVEKDRDLRYQTAAELKADLERLQQKIRSDAATPRDSAYRSRKRRNALLAIVLLGIVIAVGGYWFYTIRTAGPIRSLAVLPFENVGGNPDTEYLSDGITESTITRLSQLPELKVMARTTVFQFKGKSALEAGRLLKVEAVVTGRILQQKDTLLIQVELVNVSDGLQLWGAEYQRKFSDMLSVLQKDIAQEISGRLRLNLSGSEKTRLVRGNTSHPEAYRLYLQGRYYWNNRNEESLLKSVELYSKAIEFDPEFAIAYAALAESYAVMPSWGVATANQIAPNLMKAAKKALELDSSLAQAHAAMGLLHESQYDFKQAEKDYRRAIELDPNYATAHQWLGEVYLLKGRTEENLLESRRALDLDPLSLLITASYGLSLSYAGRYEEALEQLRRAKDLDPDYCTSVVYEAQIFRAQGKLQDAIAELEKPQARRCGSKWGLSELGYTYAVAGWKMQAKEVLEELEKESQVTYVPSNYIAVIHLGLGDTDRALYWLKKGFEERTLWCFDLHPYLSLLRSNPKFADFLQQSHLQ
jgi:TolB-like protein/Flp pilus assembly protein TadD